MFGDVFGGCLEGFRDYLWVTFGKLYVFHFVLLFPIIYFEYSYFWGDLGNL